MLSLSANLQNLQIPKNFWFTVAGFGLRLMADCKQIHSQNGPRQDSQREIRPHFFDRPEFFKRFLGIGLRTKYEAYETFCHSEHLYNFLHMPRQHSCAKFSSNHFIKIRLTASEPGSVSLTILCLFFNSLQDFQQTVAYLPHFYHGFILAYRWVNSGLKSFIMKGGDLTVWYSQCHIYWWLGDAGIICVWSTQAGKLKYCGTRPNWVVSYIAYTKFHSPRPVFHLPGQICTRIGERASASFPACNIGSENDLMPWHQVITWTKKNKKNYVCAFTKLILGIVSLFRKWAHFWQSN